MIFDLQDVEEKLHYEFRDKELIYRAFTHASYSNEIQQRSGEKPKNNEVLEFLGDAILNFVVAEELFRTLPEADQGELTQKRAEIVSKPPCAEAVEKLGLHEHIIFGVGAEAEKTRNHRAKGDLLEAVLAAIYLDGGMEPARAFVFRALGDRIRAAGKPEKPEKAPQKPKKQEPAGAGHPSYQGFPMFLGKAEHPPEEEEEELIFTEQPQTFVLEAPKKKKGRPRKDDPTTSFAAAQKRSRPTFGAPVFEFRGEQAERKPEQGALPRENGKKKGDPAGPSRGQGKRGEPAEANGPRKEKKRAEPASRAKNENAKEARPGSGGQKKGGGRPAAGQPEGRPEAAGNGKGRGQKEAPAEGRRVRPAGQDSGQNPKEGQKSKGRREPEVRKEQSAAGAGAGRALPPEEPREDFKSRLQEYCQKHYRQNPIYETLGQAGPSHDPEFSVRVSFSGVMLAQARGKSKRAAEQAAARDALELLMLPPSDKKGKKKSSKEKKH